MAVKLATDMRAFATFLLWIGLACALPALAAAPAPDRKRTESELKALAQQIEQVRQQVQRDAAERERLARELRATELTAASARGQLQKLKGERAQRSAARAALEAERVEREAHLERTRAALAAQLRAAYQLGRHDTLQLLLNQRDPARAERQFTYYGYIGKFRAAQIDEIRTDIAKIEKLSASIATEDDKLGKLEQSQKARLGDLEQARTQRGKVLVGLEQASQGRAQMLARLQQQQQALETVLRELKRAAERAAQRAPPASKGSSNGLFARLRGKLDWPTAGKLVARFGELRAGSVRWNGVMVGAERGAAVRAVAAGRVAFADWLPGLGQLVIIDHGSGWLSLYGHNDELLKASGAAVAAGEQVATVGDSGGRAQPELYFEIRSDGKPIDPRPWFQRPAPP